MIEVLPILDGPRHEPPLGPDCQVYVNWTVPYNVRSADGHLYLPSRGRNATQRQAGWWLLLNCLFGALPPDYLLTAGARRVDP